MKEAIDKRINALERVKQEYLAKGYDYSYLQTWARLEELKALKKQFTDKNGNWII